MQSKLMYRQKGGWPITVLLVAGPIVLALGFLSGMAIVTYGRPGAVVNPVVPAAGAAAPNSSGRDQSWVIPTLPAQTSGPSVPPTATLPVPTPENGQTKVTEPTQVYFTGPARDIREARLALVTDFGLYQSDAGSFRIDYQQMRQVATGTSLVGMIAVSDYETWIRVLQQEPDRLKAWLEAAAARVQGAATRDRFHLSWAIVDVMRDRPMGFANSEITPLDNRTFLIIRPLASTMDHTKTAVSIRTAASLAQAARMGATEPGSPWFSYGPVIRFDETDLYRPLRAMDAKPLATP